MAVLPLISNKLQGGSHVEVFSVQGRDPLSHWKLTGSVSRDYLKDMRGYVVVMEGGSSTTNTRMQLPKADKTSCTYNYIQCLSSKYMAQTMAQNLICIRVKIIHGGQILAYT